MDHIRKALDLARLERSQPREGDTRNDSAAGAHQQPQPAQPRASKAAALPISIVYTRTRILEPDPKVLEQNRILNPGSADPAALAFRMLRTQVLQRMNSNGWGSLAIFSPGPNDGKTTTAINLAVSIANDQRHTALLVEFDFRRPTLASRFGFTPDLGSDDALHGTAELEDCLFHPEGMERLVVLPARAEMSHSSEMLAGPKCRELMQELRARYPERIILVDLPPVLSADDALAFAPLVECGLVVASEGRTRRNDLLRTMELLQKVPLVGTVLNRAAEVATGY